MHLALDPDPGVTRLPGLVPGSAIGTLDASPINAVQRWALPISCGPPRCPRSADRPPVPRRHAQRAARIEAVPEVDLVIDRMASAHQKTSSRASRCSRSRLTHQPAIKLFVEWTFRRCPGAD